MTVSIHRRVLLWAMGALVLGAALLVGGSWWVLAHEMGEEFEDPDIEKKILRDCRKP